MYHDMYKRGGGFFFFPSHFLPPSVLSLRTFSSEKPVFVRRSFIPYHIVSHTSYMQTNKHAMRLLLVLRHVSSLVYLRVRIRRNRQQCLPPPPQTLVLFFRAIMSVACVNRGLPNEHLPSPPALAHCFPCYDIYDMHVMSTGITGTCRCRRDGPRTRREELPTSLSKLFTATRCCRRSSGATFRPRTRLVSGKQQRRFCVC